MSTTTPSTRERLLQAAGELFYARGITAVGVDAICQRAKVSKRSLYQLFSTKDELVAASLERTGGQLLPTLVPSGDDGSSPRARILLSFERLEGLSADPGYEGCPFVGAAVELKSAEHPATRVARQMKGRFTAALERELTAAGAGDPAGLAEQLTVVWDGCATRVMLTGHALNGLATATATALLDHAGVS